MDVEIIKLAECELPAAIAVVARGMRDNPINVRAMGEDVAVRLRRLMGLFALALPRLMRKGVLLAAKSGGAIVGVLGMAPPGACKASGIEKAAMAPHLLAALGPRALMRTASWQSEWEARDVSEPHWHLGPVSADAGLHGRGIGSALMRVYCERLDDENGAGYLETDKLENVTFYEKFGFETVGEASILGIPNWFMHRAQKTPPR